MRLKGLMVLFCSIFQQASSFQIDNVEMHSDEDFEKTLELLDEEGGGDNVVNTVKSVEQKMMRIW